MKTAEVLNKFKNICKGADNCQICPIGCAAMICDTPPEYWPNKDIEKIANAIDNYKKEEEKDV